MYKKDSKEFKHHVETYGAQSKFGYKDFIPMFKAEKFNPQQWVDLFKKSGAKYVVPVQNIMMDFRCIKRYDQMECCRDGAKA
jgi:alpha-L-fucosidase